MKKIPLKVTVANVEINRNKTRNVRFRLMPKQQLIRVTALHETPLFVERLDNNKFGIAPRGELPTVGRTPSEALAKGIRRFW